MAGGELEGLLLELYARSSMLAAQARLYSDRAAMERLPGVARLLRGVAEAKLVHAGLAAKRLRGVEGGEARARAPLGLGGTRGNLEALLGELRRDLEGVVPRLLEAARRAGDRAAEVAARYVEETTRIMIRALEAALEAVSRGGDLDPGGVWVCPVCGYLALGPEPPARCPVCGVPGGRFLRF